MNASERPSISVFEVQEGVNAAILVVPTYINQESKTEETAI